MRIGIDLGGTKIEGSRTRRGRTRAGPDPSRHAARRLRRRRCRRSRRSCTTSSGPPTLRCGRSCRAREHRRGHSGLHLTRDRARQERELDLVNRPSARPGSRGAPRPAGAGRERRQLFRAVGGDRWRRRGRRVVFGVIVGTGTGGGIVVDGVVIDGANAHRRRVGAQPAAVARTGRTAGRALLLRPCRVHRNVAFRSGARTRLRAGHGRRARRRGDRRSRAGGRSCCGSGARPLSLADGSRAGDRDQPARPRGHRARRRPVGDRQSLHGQCLGSGAGSCSRTASRRAWFAPATATQAASAVPRCSGQFCNSAATVAM